MEADLPSSAAATFPRRRVALTLVVTVGLALSVTGFLLLPDLLLRGERIAPNCFIEGLPVGRWSRAQTAEVIVVRFGSPAITVEANGRATAMPLSHFGGSVDTSSTVARAMAVGRIGGQWHRLGEIVGCWRAPRNFELTFAFDRQQLHHSLRKLGWTVNRLPVNATLNLIEDRLVTTPERPGTRFEVAATADRIERTYNVRNTTIKAEVTAATPRIRGADIADVTTPLVTFSTWYRAGESNRSKNIRMCAGEINGTVLMPGDSFSFNKQVGDRTAARGFQLAGMFVNGEKVQGYGGGVCQVSSTVYNAARNADLKILERHPHSLPVPYVPEGRDATVAYPYSDMKFRNTSDTPLFIEARAKGGKLTVRLWGRANAQVRQSEETPRLRVVHYPDKKKKKQAAQEELGVTPPTTAVTSDQSPVTSDQSLITGNQNPNR